MNKNFDRYETYGKFKFVFTNLVTEEVKIEDLNIMKELDEIKKPFESEVKEITIEITNICNREYYNWEK